MSSATMLSRTYLLATVTRRVLYSSYKKVFSLKKNGTGDYDRDALNRLEAAINANLDPKLHITIKDDGEIVMANGAQDPWNKEYMVGILPMQRLIKKIAVRL